MERIFLLDRSGSMESIKNDTIGGFNSFVKSQKGGTLSLVLFDHEVQEVYKNVPIEYVKPLDNETFVPRGTTALLDALGHVIKTYQGKKTVVVFTDGLENSSSKYTHAHIKDLIEQKKSEGWDFVYLGEDIKEGQSLGIQTSVPIGREELFQTLSEAMTQSSATGSTIVID